MNDAVQALHQLISSEWDYSMEHNPTWASSLGDRRWNDRWDDVSLDSIAAHHRHDLEVIDRLKGIDRSRLPAVDQLNFDLLLRQYQENVEGYQYHWYLVPLNQRGGIQTADELTETLRFETVKDYEDWIARLRAFPTSMDQTMALLRQAIRERMLLPKVIMERIPSQIDKQIVSDPGASPFYKPFRDFPASVAASDRERLSKAARETIAAGVIPAYGRFKQFFVSDYLPACYDQVGAWQMPRGHEMYAYFVRYYTTTKMTPEEVHQVGLGEVERINREMQAVIEQVGFKGSRQDFFKFLRTDPQFYYKNPDDLLEAYRAIAKRVDPKLVKVFRLLPRQPYGVEPIPAAVAPDTTTAYYQPGAGDGSRAGSYCVNLYKPETRPKWEMTALTLHESVPGHHLQIALAMEQGELPKFRRYGSYTAYVEGWGLYAESLGYAMGLYDDPYVRFGQLTYDMWRAVRLVVDTGIHAMRWDRQRAIDYFLLHAAKTELDVVNEVDRYIAWPGQALAYKIGQLKIEQLRDHAQRTLGEKFDLKEYHEVILVNGALPLDTLEQTVDAWIARINLG